MTPTSRSLCIIAISFLFVPNCKTDCIFDQLMNKTTQPLLLTTNFEFIYTSSAKDSLKIENKKTILIACPGSSINFGEIRTSNLAVAEIVCNDSKIVINNTLSMNSADLTCDKQIENTARLTGKNCNGYNTDFNEIEIGFELSATVFIRQILICFSSKNQSAIYAQHNLTKYIGSFEVGVPRTHFVQDSGIYQIPDVNALYARKNQKVSINTQLGLDSNSSRYIHDTDDFFLSRGHLAPKSDYVHASQQLATFHYVNAAPQWQTFNGGNWQLVEDNVQKLASQQNLDLLIYTGTWSVATLPHNTSNATIELYLSDLSAKDRIPVPAVFWKIVHSPVRRQAVALVGVNNPFITGNQSILCKNDVTSKIRWLSHKDSLKNVTRGFTYACEVGDLNKTIGFLPAVDVSGGLLVGISGAGKVYPGFGPIIWFNVGFLVIWYAYNLFSNEKSDYISLN